MAYSDSIGDNAYLLKRTVSGITYFAGRSRRTEVVYYWIATLLIGAVVGFAQVVLAPFQTMIWSSLFLQALFVIPMFALFVRRLHDQNRSGWWGLLLPLAIILSIPERVNELLGDFGAMLAQKESFTALALDAVTIALLILFLLPGTDGPNRFGPDPRLEEA